jgi:hypothetical protein
MKITGINFEKKLHLAAREYLVEADGQYKQASRLINEAPDADIVSIVRIALQAALLDEYHAQRDALQQEAAEQVRDLYDRDFQQRMFEKILKPLCDQPNKRQRLKRAPPQIGAALSVSQRCETEHENARANEQWRRCRLIC